MTTVLAIGTNKGLYLARSDDDRRSWRVTGPHFAMHEVYAVAIDKRRGTPRLLAGVSSPQFGASIATSVDLGVQWHEPERAPNAVPGDTGSTLDPAVQNAPC